MPPKRLVSEKTAPAQGSLLTRELIVKSAGEDYPDLAISEYVCMPITREARIPAPELHLSSNRQRFVMRRSIARPAAPAPPLEPAIRNSIDIFARRSRKA